MKKKYLIWIALIGGAYLLMAMKKKKKGYKITVPEPDKITEQEFYSQSAPMQTEDIEYRQIIKQPDIETPYQSAPDQAIYGFKGRFPDLY